MTRRRSSTETGREGEEFARAHLSRNGYHVLARNYRCRAGEIDIVALHGEVLCFIEVKARRVGAFGGGFEAIESRKQTRLRRAAEAYLQRYGSHPPACRFDVVEVWLDDCGRPEQARLLPNAF